MGYSLAAHWLGLCAFTAESPGSIPDQGTKIPQAVQHSQRKKKIKKNQKYTGTSLVAQWLRLCAPNAGGPGPIPGQGTRSHMHATTKSSHATTKEPTCRNQGAGELQL